MQTIVGENALAFSEKVDIESKKALKFVGEIKTRPESDDPSLRDIFEEQITLFEQALEFMDEGEDDDEIAALRDAIEGARLMIADDTEEQAEEEIIESIDKLRLEKMAPTLDEPKMRVAPGIQQKVWICLLYTSDAADE